MDAFPSPYQTLTFAGKKWMTMRNDLGFRQTSDSQNLNIEIAFTPLVYRVDAIVTLCYNMAE